MLGPEIVVPLGFFATIAGIVIGRPWVKALAARVENESKRPQVAPEVMSRLERMEQAIDSIAVEVERISEGQRFTTKLLSEVKDARALPERASGSSSGQANR
jgi:hypothetical protein